MCFSGSVRVMRAIDFESNCNTYINMENIIFSTETWINEAYPLPDIRHFHHLRPVQSDDADRILPVGENELFHLDLAGSYYCNTIIFITL